ncbi:28S ribosomal protein S14, mitochondrial-like [Centruroides sculpturatus]|uniref:28S ribosomal protein S14, mitochondrial-like n=1 Tax=Centruroides sculpturatus TaxID=218467 RepID=UPI000C6E9383|nr:28S ribosomal protein S14, mitochondrial-like [Centruroides sculpturatus]
MIVTPNRSTGHYTDWRMLRDVKRRKMVKDNAKLRLQINALRKNDILPRQIRDIADAEIAALPLDTAPVRLHGRCVITSRARGKLTRWRMSRIVWRHLADYNYLSGVQRSIW